MEQTQQHHCLEIPIDQALFAGEIDGIVLACHENERPLAGLAGWLDWYFHGEISACLRAGALSGNAGECAYIPIQKNGATHHLLLVGAGRSDQPGHRKLLPIESLRKLKKNLTSLFLEQSKKIGVSRADLGNASDEFFAKNMKEVSLWIAP